jgi:MOSC domain-containing protein YiiM/ferredoxin-NADP reductase
MSLAIESSAVGLAPLPPTDTLLSLRTGKIRPLGGVNIRTAINKRARQGKWEVTPLGLVGDEQQFIHHGGPEKALHQYCATHYDAWNAELPGREGLFKVGGFGENLSTMNMSETNVCIGDIFRVGREVLIQVSGPRQPCYKLNHRFQHKKISAMTQSSGRTGWYYRVLQTGFIEQGDALELVERTNPTWSLSRVQKYLYHEKDNIEIFQELVTLPALSEEMVGIFQGRLDHGTEDMSGRLEGDRVPVVWRPYKLASKTDLTPRIKSFIFESEDQSEDLKFGQFPFVRIQFGPDGSISRAYSVVSGTTSRFELGIARDDNSRGGSIYLHDDLTVGNVIKVAPGHNAPASQNGGVDSNASKHIFIIGGIGVTAFLGEIKRLSRESAEVEIHYAVRSLKDAAYLSRLPLDKTTIYAKGDGQRLMLGQVIPELTNDKKDVPMVYCCGPTSLMNACRNLTTNLGYPKANVHFEEFGDATTGTGEPFEVEIKSTGQRVQVPREKSLLQVLSDAGFEIESSCLVGNCGTCMVDYYKGEVDHKGVALDEEQKKGSMLSCVSRGKGKIVI